MAGWVATIRPTGSVFVLILVFVVAAAFLAVASNREGFTSGLKSGALSHNWVARVAEEVAARTDGNVALTHDEHRGRGGGGHDVRCSVRLGLVAVVGGDFLCALGAGGAVGGR